MSTRILKIVATAGCVALIAFSSTSQAQVLAGGYFWRYFPKVAPLFAIHARDAADVSFIAEKGVHVVLFTMLGIMLWSAFPRRHRSPSNVFATGAIVGVCSEVMQSFYPSRDPTIRDAVLNAIGTALGIAICLLTTRHDDRAAER